MNQQVSEKCCRILYKETEALPFEREFSNENNTSTYSLPLTSNYTSLCLAMSKEQKQRLFQEINKAKKLKQMKDEIVKVNSDLNHTMLNLQQTMKIKPNKQLIDYIPSCVYGSDSLVEMPSDYYFNHSYHSNVENEKQNQVNTNITICVLIYQGEEFSSLQASIKFYTEQMIQTIVLINGKLDFLKLILSKEDTFKKIYQQSYISFEKKYSTSSSHALLFEREDFQFTTFIVFPQALNQIQLIKWVYLGICRYVDPEFAIITSSNQQFKIDNSNFKKLISVCSVEQYFGVQWMDKVKRNSNSSGLKYLINFLDYGSVTIGIDGLFPVKQFHNPLSCIYNWKKISSYITSYYSQLYEQSQTNDIGLRLNSLLPAMMYQEQKQELCQLSSEISEINFDSMGQLDVFQKIGARTFSIQQQLLQGVLISNLAIECCNKFKFIQQQLISILFYLPQYFSLSICLFFSFQSPYQLLFYLLDQSKGYTALSIIIPSLYALNILMFIIISLLYRLGDKIIIKEERKNSDLVVHYNNKNKQFKFLLKNSNCNDQKCIGTYEDCDQSLTIDVIKESMVQTFQKKKISQPEGYFKIKMPELFNISTTFELLILNQRILDIAVVLATFANLILVYGQNFIWDIKLYQIILLISAIVIIVLLLCKNHRVFNIRSWVLLLSNFSVLNFLSSMYCMTEKVGTSEMQSQKKRQLALELLLNFLALYIYIAIESYYEYSGYVFLIIIVYLAFMQILSLFLYSIKQCFDYNYTKQEETQIIYHSDPNSELTIDEGIDETLKHSRELIEKVTKYKELLISNPQIQRNIQQQQNNVPTQQNQYDFHQLIDSNREIKITQEKSKSSKNVLAQAPASNFDQRPIHSKLNQEMLQSQKNSK